MKVFLKRLKRGHSVGKFFGVANAITAQGDTNPSDATACKCASKLGMHDEEDQLYCIGTYDSNRNLKIFKALLKLVIS